MQFLTCFNILFTKFVDKSFDYLTIPLISASFLTAFLIMSGESAKMTVFGEKQS